MNYIDISIIILTVIVTAIFVCWLFPTKNTLQEAKEKREREDENKPFFERNKLKEGKDIIITGHVAYLDGYNEHLVFFKYCNKTKTLIKLKW